MKAAFTICSNNYLAKAKVVVDSFKQHHPDYRFFVFLVDKLDPKLNYDGFNGTEVVEVHTIVQDILPLAKKYNIIELNTAVKPDIFIHLFQQFNFENILYLDPDLMIFDRFVEVEEVLNMPEHNMVVTPHFCSPIDDGKYPSEIDFAPFGLYNLGFIAIKNTSESKRFLEWWRQRLMKYCYIKPGEGMFTDQLWVNIAPIFFDGMFVLKNLGYNAANWNLYERKMTQKEGRWIVNGQQHLKFFHFSQYEYANPYSIGKFQNRHTIEERPDMKMLIDTYQEKIVENNFEDFHKSPCYYHQLHLEHVAATKAAERSVVLRIKRRFRSYVSAVKKNG